MLAFGPNCASIASWVARWPFLLVALSPCWASTAPSDLRAASSRWEVLSRHEFENTRQAQAVALDWCYGFYNHDRRHSSAGMMNPVNYENTAVPSREAA